MADWGCGGVGRGREGWTGWGWRCWLGGWRAGAVGYSGLWGATGGDPGEWREVLFFYTRPVPHESHKAIFQARMSLVNGFSVMPRR